MKNKTKVNCNLLIAQQKESNMTIGEFCQSNEISVSAFKYHLYHGKETANDDVVTDEDISFVPVQITKQDQTADSFIEIMLSSNASIRVDPTSKSLFIFCSRKY